MSEEQEASKPVEKLMLLRLRQAIMKQYPVNISDFLNNYVNMFQETIKPEEFGCPSMDRFINKMSVDYKIWSTFYKENQILIKPTRDTVVQMTDQEDDPSDIEKTKQSLPNDAVFQDGFPPLILPGLAENKDYPVVVTDIISYEKIWFNIYHQEYYGALQSLMKALSQFYNSAAGDSYKVQNIQSMKVGSVLAARYREGDYHRVVLRRVLPNNKMVRLEYVDYGTVAYQNVEYCRYLTPSFTELPAQAVEARMWAITSVPGAKTEQGDTLNNKLEELLIRDCDPGTLLAVIKSGVNQQEFDGVRVHHEKRTMLTSKRAMGVEFYDAVRAGGTNIGKALVDLGLATPETGEKSYFGDGEDFYIKYLKDKRAGNLIVPRGVQEIVMKDSDRFQASGHLQLLRHHEASLASRLEKIKVEAARERKHSANIHEIWKKIHRYQGKLNVIKERKEMKEKEEEETNKQ